MFRNGKDKMDVILNGINNDMDKNFGFEIKLLEYNSLLVSITSYIDYLIQSLSKAIIEHVDNLTEDMAKFYNLSGIVFSFPISRKI